MKPPAKDPQVDFAGAIGRAQFQAQWLLDRLVAAPEWIGWALLAWAALLLVLGRRGQGVLAGSLLGLGVVVLALGTLQPALEVGSIAPGLLALFGGAGALLFGIASPGWGSAGICAIGLGYGGAFLAHDLFGFLAIGGAAPGAGLGLFAGISNHRRLAVFLPQLFAGLALALGAANLLASHRRGAAVPQLASLEWALGLAAALALPLIALSVEREARNTRRLLSRTKAMKDDELRLRLAKSRDQTPLA